MIKDSCLLLLDDLITRDELTSEKSGPLSEILREFGTCLFLVPDPGEQKPQMIDHVSLEIHKFSLGDEIRVNLARLLSKIKTTFIIIPSSLESLMLANEVHEVRNLVISRGFVIMDFFQKMKVVPGPGESGESNRNVSINFGNQRFFVFSRNALVDALQRVYEHQPTIFDSQWKSFSIFNMNSSALGIFVDQLTRMKINSFRPGVAIFCDTEKIDNELRSSHYGLRFRFWIYEFKKCLADLISVMKRTIRLFLPRIP